MSGHSVWPQQSPHPILCTPDSAALRGTGGGGLPSTEGGTSSSRPGPGPVCPAPPPTGPRRSRPLPPPRPWGPGRALVPMGGAGRGRCSSPRRCPQTTLYGQEASQPGGIRSPSKGRAVGEPCRRLSAPNSAGEPGLPRPLFHFETSRWGQRRGSPPAAPWNPGAAGVPWAATGGQPPLPHHANYTGARGRGPPA